MIHQLQRVCVKRYALEPHDLADDVFVPIFHRWIRERAIAGVLLDVADYTHVPDGPGVMLVAHDAAIALDRSDGRFGLLVQRRRPVAGDATDAIEAALRLMLTVTDALEAEPDLSARLIFDRTAVRVEANDRLRAPNTDDAFDVFAPVASAAVLRVLPNASANVIRVDTDPRNRLAVDVRSGP